MRRDPISMQRRLAWRLLLMFLILLGFAFGGFLYQAMSVADLMRDKTLQAQASDIAGHITVGPDGGMRVDVPETLRQQYARSDSGYFFAVYGGHDRIVATSSREKARLFSPFIPSGTASRFFRINAETPAGPYFGYITSAQGLRIAVAQGKIHGDVLEDSLMEEFFEATVWWVIPVILIAVWTGVITIRTSLAPLTVLSESILAIGPATTGRRLSERRVPVEVLPLVQAVNGALDRLEKGFNAQRRFTADAAHQLRTPVALLQARIDSIEPDVPDVEGLRRDVARIHRVIAQLLRIARLDSVEADLSEDVDLCRLTTETLADLAPLALRQGRKLSLERETTEVRVRGNRQLLSEAVTNLVENAMAYAPHGTTVIARITGDGTVEVVDEGPGVEDAHREAIFERFWRVPESNGSGAGLGLAIVRDIARIHGGTVGVSDGPGGGAAFALRLPVGESALTGEDGVPSIGTAKARG